MSRKSTKCEKCDVRIPASYPRLYCYLCEELKHFRCEGLSKLEAFNTISNVHSDWICRSCISAALPLNCFDITRRRNTELIGPKFKVKCYSCDGYSYTPHNVKTCEWCSHQSHKKCMIGNLGCKKCCTDNFAGFSSTSWELFGGQPCNDKIYNPYDPDKLINRIGNTLDNIDEGNSEWNDVSDFLLRCKYKLLKDVTSSNTEELSILSLNIRSLNKNVSIISDNMTQFSKFDVLCFNETNCDVSKLANGLSDLTLEGFHPPVLKAPFRKSGRGGGLAVYVRNTVCCEDDIDILDLGLDEKTIDGDGEFLPLRIRNCKSKNRSVILLNTYRSPSRKPLKFNVALEHILQKLGRFKNKHALVIGDFNIDLIKYESDNHAQNLIDCTSKFGFAQTISRPTRVTDHSATLIDHIYSNMIHKVISSNVITTDLSDHLATSVFISLDTHYDRTILHLPTDNGQCHDYRIFNESNNLKFKELIHNETWELDENLNANDQYDSLMKIYERHYDEAFQLKKSRQKRKKERIEPKPWILPWLENACDRKNRLYKDWVSHPTDKNYQSYKKMKLFCNKRINKAKAKFYKNYFDEHFGDSKKQWNMINSLLNRNRKKVNVAKLTDKDGLSVTSAEAIAGKFNDYFGNIAKNLKSKIATKTTLNSTDDYKSYLGDSTVGSIFLTPVSATEIDSTINKLQNKATLDTKISALKAAGTCLTLKNALAKVITKSFEQGIFPTALKLARVVPIHKGGSRSDVSNYRPISLLSTMSKIYEKLMHYRIVKFMEVNKSIYENQFGFRAGRSCEHALLNAKSNICSALSQRKISLLLLIDFSKAFDMVEHEILLGKLYHYGIRGLAYEWMKSYLTNREQFVSVGGKDSDTSTLEYGVPQGSILGPLLFIIYINDIPNLFKNAQFILYADDANIFITGSNILDIKQQVTKLGDELVKWVNCNGLALNLKKTNYIIFSRSKLDGDLSLTINNETIARKKEARFLGVIVDENLTWEKHILSVKQKMSRYVGIMYKLKNKVPLSVRLQIYHSFVQSHLNYCSIIWGFAAKTHIAGLFSAQKKGLRAILPGYTTSFYKDGILPTPTKVHFVKYGILSVYSIICKNALLLLDKAKYFTDQVPPSVVNKINQSSLPTDVSQLTAWNDKFGYGKYRNSFFFKGTLLRDQIKYQKSMYLGGSVQTLKKIIKGVLLDIQGSGDIEEWLPENNPLFCVAGVRKSARIAKINDNT